MKTARVLLLALVLASHHQAPAQDQTTAAAPLSLQPGDHIAIIGSALADRMQHSGYFETLLHAQYPDHRLVVRNLAVAGDEVVTRHRSENFGSPDQWLEKVGADCILAFFGYNESFQGAAGIDRFRVDLERFIEETRTKNYSGHGAPRLVLVSPTAAERHPDPNFPDPGAINSNLVAYVAVMAEVARKQGVPFVDLFHPSEGLLTESASAGRPLTVNGVYLTDDGDRLVAPLLFRAIFGVPAPSGDLQRLRAAVNEKNRQWHRRYRTVDGYNVYGGRSALAYQPDKGGFISDRQAPEPYVSNYKVMQQEMKQRDVLTANRDQRVWAVARGGDLQVDDSNLPDVTPVRSNKPGPNPDGSHDFLTGEEAIGSMTGHSGMKINLYADEKQFPDLVNPVQMAWDTRGRLWVAAWLNYPERTPTSTVGDKLLVFEDTDGDGRADRVTPFLQDLNCPTGFQFYKDGVLVMQAPDLWFVRDTDGDGRADWKERVLMGLDSADSHHTANALCHEPGGAIYLSDGVFHRTQVETAGGPVRNDDAAIYRFEPWSGRFETYIAYGFANPHGRVFDRWGNDLVTDATGNNTYFGPAFSGRINYPAKHSGMKQFWERPSRPCPGTGILSSRHFPVEFQGNFLNINVIGFQGIFRVKVTDDGSGLQGETLEHLVQSTDPNFRPTAIDVGPDGALYFLDWYNPIIGHMQHHIRDPNRDHGHGRIYRITYEGRPLLQPKKIHGQPIPALLDLLKEPEDGVRELAKVELGTRNSRDVIAATRQWIAALDPSDPEHQHHLMEGLWVHQWQNVVDPALLRRMLESPEPRARAAAGRVLCYWRDRVPDALGLFRKLANDEHPRVRLEAVRAASFFTGIDAAEVALATLRKPVDYYLDYTLKETLRQLEPWWRPALADGRTIAADNPAGLRFLFDRLSTKDLQGVPHSGPVLEALLHRPALSDSDRSVALIELARSRNTAPAAVLLDLVEAAVKDGHPDAGLVRLLPLQLPEQLAPLRPRVVNLTASATPREVRPAAWATLAATDDSFDKVWPAAVASPATLADLIDGIPSLNDPEFRARAYARVKPLLAEPEAPFPVGAAIPAEDANAIRRAAIHALVTMGTGYEATFSDLAALIRRSQHVALAAQALRVLPRASWPSSQIGPTTSALLAWAKSVPAAGRTGEDYLQALQTAGDLAGMLPPAESAAARQELRELRVSVFVIHTVREQMRYDTARIVVEAGKPFEIIIENDDFMPHNLVVVKPGGREKIGPAADKMSPEQLDGQGRAFVPDSPEILAATRLLESGVKARLKLVAPTTEGICEYVCTFPNHWPAMWGQLVVTSDVDAYLQKHPIANLPPPADHHNHGFE